MTPPSSIDETFPDDGSAYWDSPETWSRVSQTLQRIAYSIVGNERDAEDIVQGAWYEALRSSGQRPALGWLRRLVRYRSIDTIRRRQREPLQSMESLPPGEEPTDPDLQYKLDAQQEVLEAVRALEEPYRSTVWLRYFEGITPKEIAARLGVPERTIKTRLTRAHTQLRGRLGERCRDERGAWSPGLVAFALGGGAPSSVAGLVPTTGVLLMKKVALIAAGLALLLVLPYAFDRSPREDSGLTQAAPFEALRGTESPDVPANQQSGTTREVLTASNPTADKHDPKVAHAFPARPTERVGTLEMQVQWADGTPAGHLGIKLVPWDAPDPHLFQREVFTNSAGSAVVDQLAPGQVGVYLGRGGAEVVTVRAGEVTRQHLTAPEGTTVFGRVLDPQGRPVAGAAVCLSDHGNTGEGHAVAVSDALGRYEVRDIHNQQYLSARASGFAPSNQFYAKRAFGERTEIDLPLQAGAAGIEGIALSPAGLPVVGARILLEREELQPGKSTGESDGEVHRALPIQLVTDEHGRFATDVVGAGTITVLARTERWVPWQHEFRLTPNETRNITVAFESGVTLTGIVQDEAGQAAPEVAVLVGPYGGFLAHRTQTDAEGRFALHGLPGGPVVLRFDGEGYAKLRKEVVLSETQPNALEFVLEKRPRVTGLVADHNGEPLSRWYVAVEPQPGLIQSHTWTNERGEFHLVGVPSETTDLVVGTGSMHRNGSQYLARHVLPADGPVRIVVPRESQLTSSLQFKVLVGGDPAPVDTRVILRSQNPFVYLELYPDSMGRVQVEPLATLELDLEVHLDGYASLRRAVPIGYEQAVDLGALELEPGGRVRVEAAGLDANTPAQAEVVDSQGRRITWFALSGGQGESELLPIGTHTLRVVAGSHAVQFLEAEVRTGETTTLQLPLRPGTERVLVPKSASGRGLHPATEIEVLDASRRVLTRFSTAPMQSLPNLEPRFSIRGLELGSYEILVHQPGQEVQRFPLLVTTLEQTAAKPVVLSLP